MNMKLLAGATALVLFAGGEVLAQVTTMEIAPEQRTRIKEYIVRERVSPATVRERIAVGARLSADIELRSVPSAWGPSVSKYRYSVERTALRERGIFFDTVCGAEPRSVALHGGVWMAIG